MKMDYIYYQNGQPTFYVTKAEKDEKSELRMEEIKKQLSGDGKKK